MADDSPGIPNDSVLEATTDLSSYTCEMLFPKCSPPTHRAYRIRCFFIVGAKPDGVFLEKLLFKSWISHGCPQIIESSSI
jgi:hypothetical protein